MKVLRPQRGEALVEAAMIITTLMLLVFGVVGAARLVRTQMALSGVAREAARAGALANSPAEARSQGEARGREVAAGYNLRDGSLTVSVEPGTLEPGGQVLARARYRIAFADLPLLRWTSVEVKGSHMERVDLYRSRQPREGDR